MNECPRPAGGRALPFAAALLVSLLSALAPAAHAQRGKAKFEWQDREAVLDYGVARLGKHSLDELPVGGEWRLGNNNASTLTTLMPVISGDAVVPPGAYRVKLLRPGEQDFQIAVEGADQGKASVGLAGLFKKLEKAKEQLAITWSGDDSKPSDKQNRATNLSVQFGSYQLTVPALLIGTSHQRAGGWDVDAFSYPAAVLEKRLDAGKPTPVATFKRGGKHDHKEPEFFNLLVTRTSASLVPAMQAPTDSYGFGEIVPPDAAWTRNGTVSWDKATDSKPCLEISALELSKTRELTCTLSIGQRTGKVSVRDPYAPAAPAAK